VVLACPAWRVHPHYWFVVTLPLRLSASGRRIDIIMLTNDTSFWPCSVSLYLSLPRKLIGLLGPSSPVRLMAATWSLPDCGWWKRWDCFLFCFTPIRWVGLALFQSSYPCLIVGLLEQSRDSPSHPPLLPWLSLPPPCTQASHPSYQCSCCCRASPHWQCQVHW